MTYATHRERTGVKPDGVMCRRDRLVIPSRLHKAVLGEWHKDHLGENMKSLNRQMCWWLKWDANISAQQRWTVRRVCTKSILNQKWEFIARKLGSVAAYKRRLLWAMREHLVRALWLAALRSCHRYFAVFLTDIWFDYDLYSPLQSIGMIVL